MDTSLLHRSTRSTCYDGFRVAQPSDTKKAPAKVKPRKNPAITSSASTTAPSRSSESVQARQVIVEVHIPPHTHIPVIQEIGSTRCGIPPEDLREDKLLAGASTASDSPK